MNANIQTLREINTLLPFNKDKYSKFVEQHTQGLTNIIERVKTITDEVELTVFSGMDINQLLETSILVAAQNIQDDIDYETIAVRFALTRIYLTSLQLKDASDSFDTIYRKSFRNYITKAVEEELLHPDMITKFDLDELSKELVIERDDVFRYIGISTLENRYMIKYRDQSTAETPQFAWMRVAMGMSVKEKDPTAWAKKFYERLSKLEYIPGGSTMIGSGTPKPVLSNCYLLDTDDDINHIFDNVKNVALISKATGGIGISITKLRAEGSPIKSNNTFSSGPIPFAHVLDSTIRAVSRAGKKLGAMALYMENWHYNFMEFLDLRQNAGDDYRRTRTADTAAYISDEFMKRVINNEDWYLFDPQEAKDLTELYGAEFSKKYSEYVEMAKTGKMKMFKVMPAREQMKKILTSLLSTSHPWLTWKDTINLRALNNNTGTIHCSNLCTEVCLPQDKNNIAVCNLLYVNLVPHIKETGATAHQRIDWERLRDSVRLGLRHLDNLIDINMLTVKEAENSDQKNRAVGLGIMGFAEILEKLGYAYDSEEAYELMDKVMEFVSYNTIDESCNLAQERGSYDNFEGSLWSKGFVPYDSIQRVEDGRKWEKLDHSSSIVDDKKDNKLNNTLEILKGKLQSGVVQTSDEQKEELAKLLEQLTQVIAQDKETQEVIEGKEETSYFSQDRSMRLAWDKLREKVKKGVRNATTMMIAPNASTGLVEGTSPGVDPRFAQIFSRNTSNGKFLDINHNLVNDLKKLGLWDSVKTKVLENYGDIQGIDEIPDNIKAIYKTSFQLSPYAFIEVASRAQKWIDQSISRNMYLETRDIDEMIEIYTEAWRRGLKTTYYLHSKPRHNSEQSTVKVNKAKAINKAGFGAVSQVQTPSAQMSLDGKKEVKGFGFAMQQKAESGEGEVTSMSHLQKAQTVSAVPEPHLQEEQPESKSSGGGFGFGKTHADIKATESVVSEDVEMKKFQKINIGQNCPIDPMERALCEGCQ